MTIFGIDNRTPSQYNNIFKGTSWLGNFSGVLVSNDLVLSASHVVKHYINTTVSFNTLEGKVLGTAVYIDRYNDIVLFQLNKVLTKTQPLKLNVASQQLLNIESSLVGFHGDTKEQTKVSDKNTRLVQSELQYTLDAYKGSSGGPILDYKNRVVGINSSEYNDTNVGSRITYDLINTIRSFDNKKNGPSKLNNQPLLNKTDITRILDTKTGAHLYTGDAEVIQDLTGDSRFRFEDNWKDSKENDVYEFYNSATGDFFYTSNYTEMLYVDEYIPQYENNGRVFGVEDNTIHRLYNSHNGMHFYTDDFKEAIYATEHYGFHIEGFLN